MEPKQVLALVPLMVVQVVQAELVVQVGGNATIGRGQCRVVLAGGK